MYVRVLCVHAWPCTRVHTCACVAFGVCDIQCVCVTFSVCVPPPHNYSYLNRLHLCTLEPCSKEESQHKRLPLYNVVIYLRAHTSTTVEPARPDTGSVYRTGGEKKERGGGGRGWRGVSAGIPNFVSWLESRTVFDSKGGGREDKTWPKQVFSPQSGGGRLLLASVGHTVLYSRKDMLVISLTSCLQSSWTRVRYPILAHLKWLLNSDQRSCFLKFVTY